MTRCSCWCKYPNTAHRKSNGKWKCVDYYRCIRDIRETDGKNKTVCEKVEKKEEKMNILELVHYLLEDKLNRGCEDFIDIRFTRDQAKELYETIHRIITWDKNMKGGLNDRQIDL